MAEDRDYYEILGIDRNADAETIKSAYRKLAKKYHPDLHPGDTDAEKHFKEVNEAYSVLSDPDKKAKYDQFGKAAFDPTAGAGGGYGGDFTDFGDLGDIFGSIFGGAFGGGTTSRRTGPQRGEDVQVRLTLSFEEAVAGCKKEVNYARLHKCPACGGSGAGVSSSGAAGASEPASASGSAVNSSVYGTTLADIQAKGELVIGLDDTFAPMGFRDESGNLVGFDIDLATAVCEELGVKATFQPIDWDAKEMELSSGNIDCIWNGMSITPEREEAMSLSQAYLNNKIVIMTKEGVTVSAKEDLANYNIGIQAGSAALEAVTNDAVYASIQDKITEYPTYDEVILDVQAGRLDCMIIDEVYGGYKNAKLGSIFAVSEVDFGDDLYAIGFRKGDAELTQAVNDAINALIESGKAAEISEAWFGADIVVKG